MYRNRCFVLFLFCLRNRQRKREVQFNRGRVPIAISGDRNFVIMPISSILVTLKGSAANIWPRFDFKLVKNLLQACHAAFNAKHVEILQHIRQNKIALKLHFCSKIHQNRFRLGLRPRPYRGFTGLYTVLPITLSVGEEELAQASTSSEP